MDMNLSKFWVIVEARGVCRAAAPEVAKRWIGLSDWTKTVGVDG